MSKLGETEIGHKDENCVIVKQIHIMISDTLLRSAMASKLAYAKNTHSVVRFPLSKHLLSAKERYEIIDSGAHAYVWATGERATVVSFRGAHTLSEVTKYINTEQVSFSFCENKLKIHRVIRDMFEHIEPQLTNVLFGNEGLSKKKHITFCGHSLGGALAMFAAAYYSCMTNKNHNISCHTFGAPKVGDKNFIKWYKSWVAESVHIINKLDVVPLFPFGNAFEDFDDKVEFPSLSHNPVYDHDLDAYIENIRNELHKRRFTVKE